MRARAGGAEFRRCCRDALSVRDQAEWKRSSRCAGERSGARADMPRWVRTWPKAVESAGLKVVSANRAERSVLAEHGMSAFSYGENVAVFVHRVDVTAHRWAKPIFDELDRHFRSRRVGGCLHFLPTQQRAKLVAGSTRRTLSREAELKPRGLGPRRGNISS